MSACWPWAWLHRRRREREYVRLENLDRRARARVLGEWITTRWHWRCPCSQRGGTADGGT